MQDASMAADAPQIQDDGMPAKEVVQQFTRDVAEGRVQDLTTLLRARNGPVCLEEINELSLELRRLDHPFLPSSHMVQNPKYVRQEISTFRERRQLLSAYRQILHDIRQLQHRDVALARSRAQIRALQDMKVTGAEAADIAARIGFWAEAVMRDERALAQIEARLRETCPLPLSEIRARVSD